MYENVLYPTDGSGGAEAAIENCRDLAETYGATVHVLYVVDDLGHHGLAADVEQPTDGGGGMVGSPEGGVGGMVGDRIASEEFRAAAEEHGEQVVTDTADRFGELETRTAVREGNPYEVILEYAESNDVDIIVMGTHGRTGLDRYLLGSVTEKVVRLSDMPVLTVRESDGT